MTAVRPKLDIDTTRDRLIALGCTHAAEQLEHLLSEAVRQEIPAHSFILNSAVAGSFAGPSLLLLNPE